MPLLLPSYLYRVQNLDDTRVAHGPQFLEGVLGEGEGRSVCRDVEREDAAVGAVLLRGRRCQQVWP